jgi:hypothetical protein
MGEVRDNNLAEILSWIYSLLVQNAWVAALQKAALDAGPGASLGILHPSRTAAWRVCFGKPVLKERDEQQNNAP